MTHQPRSILAIVVLIFALSACGGKKQPPPNEPAKPAATACEPVTCEIKCVNGFEKDANGCSICKCASAPSASAACAPVTCELKCQNGFATDDKGCEVCKCR